MLWLFISHHSFHFKIIVIYLFVVIVFIEICMPCLLNCFLSSSYSVIFKYLSAAKKTYLDFNLEILPVFFFFIYFIACALGVIPLKNQDPHQGVFSQLLLLEVL